MVHRLNAKKSSILLLLILLLNCLYIDLKITNVHSVKDHWAIDFDGFYLRGEYNIINGTHCRTKDSWITYNESTKIYNAELGWGEWVKNNSGYWQPYVFEEYPNYFKVQTSLIGAEIYDYYAKYYDPYFNEVRLYDERWKVEKWKTQGQGKWEDIGAQSGTPILTALTNNSGVYVDKCFHSWAGWLNITYIFKVGKALKHVVVFESEIQSNETFRVTQEWNGITGTKVKHQSGSNNINGLIIVESPYFEFQKENGNLCIFENQYSMMYNDEDEKLNQSCLMPVLIDTHSQGMKATFTFSNWTLDYEEYLTIDPDTATLTPPNMDSYIQEDQANTNYGTANTLRVRAYASLTRTRRTLTFFHLGSIPAGSTIDLARLDLYYFDKSGNDPVGRTYYTYFVDSHNWTENGVTWNKYDGVSNWDSAGGDYDTTAGASDTVPNSYTWMNWTVTEIVRSWMNSSNNNYGFITKDSNEATANEHACSFYSKEEAVETSKRPILYIEYTPPIAEESYCLQIKACKCDNATALTPYQRIYASLVNGTGTYWLQANSTSHFKWCGQNETDVIVSIHYQNTTNTNCKVYEKTFDLSASAITENAKCQVLDFTFYAEDNAGDLLYDDGCKYYCTFVNGTSFIQSINSSTLTLSNMNNGTLSYRVKWHKNWVTPTETIPLNCTISSFNITCLVANLVPSGYYWNLTTIVTHDLDFRLTCPNSTIITWINANATGNYLYQMLQNGTYKIEARYYDRKVYENNAYSLTGLLNIDKDDFKVKCEIWTLNVTCRFYNHTLIPDLNCDIHFWFSNGTLETYEDDRSVLIEVFNGTSYARCQYNGEWQQAQQTVTLNDGAPTLYYLTSIEEEEPPEEEAPMNVGMVVGMSLVGGLIGALLIVDYKKEKPII